MILQPGEPQAPASRRAATLLPTCCSAPASLTRLICTDSSARNRSFFWGAASREDCSLLLVSCPRNPGWVITARRGKPQLPQLLPELLSELCAGTRQFQKPERAGADAALLVCNHLVQKHRLGWVFPGILPFLPFSGGLAFGERVIGEITGLQVAQNRVGSGQGGGRRLWQALPWCISCELGSPPNRAGAGRLPLLLPPYYLWGDPSKSHPPHLEISRGSRLQSI